jgi:putative ABC transport system permease protein
VLLRPLPFPDGDRLVRVQQQNLKTPVTLLSPARLADWDRLNHTFVALTGFYTEDVSETSGDLPEKLTRAFVAPHFLDVWGIAPAIGRNFSEDETRPGGPLAVLVSERFWRRRLNADPSAVGQQLRFGTAAPAIVGVMPASFRFPIPDVDVWWPVTLNPSLARLREATWYTVVGRLNPRVTAAQAQTDLSTVQRQLALQYPATDAGLTVVVRPLAADLAGNLSVSLWLLFASATILLMIACVNVAGLMLVRAIDRQPEFSIRASLGASPGTLAAQVVTEAGVIAVAGTIVGLAIASGISRMTQVYAARLPRLDEMRTDWRVTLYAVAITVAVTLMCSLIPLRRVSDRRVAHAGAGGTRTEVSGAGGAQWVLVGIQVALAMLLLACGGLLVRSIQKLAEVAPGFDPSHIVTFHVSGSYAETTDFARLTRRIDRTLDALRAIPGVQAAATAGALPGVPGRFLTELTLAEGRAETEPKLVADSRYVAESYFDTVGLAILEGERCRQSSPLVVQSAVVNRTFARTYFGDVSPIGYHLKLSGFGTPDPVVIEGVVGDAREQGLDRMPSPTVYWCLAAPGPSPFFLVRTAIPPGALTETLRRRMKDLEPTRAVFGIEPLTAQLDAAYTEGRLRALVLAVFAGLAVILACVGIYGTVSYVVTSRRREIGLRRALGATSGQIVRRFLGQGIVVSSVACGAGLGASLLVTRWLSSMLYGVSPWDPITFIAAVALVLGGAVVASLVPSTRAASAEPMDALRTE